MLSYFKPKSDEPALGVQLLSDALIVVVPAGKGASTPSIIVRDSSPDCHADVLKQLVVEQKLSGSLANVVLSPKAHKAHLIELPAVPEQEYADAAKWRIREMLDFAVEDAVVDTFEYPSEALRGRKPQLNVRVVREQEVLTTLEVLRASGLQPSKITTIDLALTSVILESSELQASGNVLLYIGHNYGLFLYIRNQQLYLAREFEFPYAALNEPSQQEQRLAQLTLEVQRSFDYLESQMGLAPPKKISLSAPDARLPLANMIGGALGIEVENFNVEANVDNPDKQSAYSQLQRGLFALGAAFEKQDPSKCINLYTEQFVPQREHIGLKHVTASAVAAIVLVALIFYWQSASLADLQEQQASELASLTALRAKVDELAQREAQLVLDPILVKQVENRRREVEAYRSLLGQLGSSVPAADFRYSTFFESLAEHRPQKLWLNKFSMNNKTGLMNIEGLTLDAHEIPAFLEGLQTEPLFAAKAFGAFVVDEHIDQEGLYQFQLHTAKRSATQ